jgi:hypothetical protein
MLAAFNLHTSVSSSMFSGVIWLAGFYRVCHAAPPWLVQSPFWVPGP